MKEHCASCNYYKIESEDEFVSRCRRFPPVLITGLSEDESELITGVSSNESDFFSHPWVKASDWCGEYKARRRNGK